MLLHPHPFLVSLGVPLSLASVACSETASFINAAHTQLQAQTLNSWSEFRPQLTLLLFVSVSLSLSLFPPGCPLISPQGLYSFPFLDISGWGDKKKSLFNLIGGA